MWLQTSLASQACPPLSQATAAPTRGVQYGIFLAYNKQRYAQMPDFSPGALDTIDEVESYLYITSCLIERRAGTSPLSFFNVYLCESTSSMPCSSAK